MADRFTNPFSRFLTDNISGLSGGKLEFFVAGSTVTLKDTFTDNTLGTPNSNPVIISASGVVPDIYLDGDYRVVLSDSDGVQQDEADNINAGTGNFSAFSLWDSSIDYASGGSIIVTGSDGNAYTSIDTPNLANDPVSSPLFWKRKYFISDTDPTMGGPLASNSHQIQWSKGADVASATALPVLTDGNYFDVTGTATITSINTTAVGTVIKLHFDDTLTLTHNATDLVLPGAANITTAAGDEAEFVEYASGDYRCTSYLRASGGSAGGGSLVFISLASASSDATIDFTGITSAFDEYEVHLQNVIPATDNVQLEMRTSTDGGSSFDSGASDYSWGIMYQVDITVIAAQDLLDNAMRIGTSIGSGANELGVSAVVTIVRPSEATYTRMGGTGMRTDLNGDPGPISFGGQRMSAADVDAVQFLFDSGNVESGLFTLYGVKKL